MRKMISLSAAVADAFGKLTGKAGPEWFCTHDPVGRKLGSGGGTVHLLRETWKREGATGGFPTWLEREQGILLHAGGQSRRLPAYAAEGKALIPVPVFRWSLGQRIDQTLLDLQVPFLERVMAGADPESRWLVASGDVLLHAERLPERLPAADVVCLGLWGEPEQATRHGVFFTPRSRPEELAFMLQKPTLEEMRRCSSEHYFLLDVGVWILSARAVNLLLRRCMGNPAALESGQIGNYDLYGDFGPAMGSRPYVDDVEVNALRTAVVPLEGGEFYHFGSGPDLIQSSLNLQNRIIDQRRLTSRHIKPHPSMFVQNSLVARGRLCPDQSRMWIENSHVPEGWNLSREHVITGVPENDWQLDLPAGTCLDVCPLRDGRRVVRVYGFRDPFRGEVGAGDTLYCGQALADWLAARGLTLTDLGGTATTDIQQVPLFPVFEGKIDGAFVQWLISAEGAEDFSGTYRCMPRVSAEEISARADLLAIRAQREENLAASLPVLAENADRSVLYQVDLEDLAGKFSRFSISVPEKRPEASDDLFRHVRDAMFRSQVQRLRKEPFEKEEARAFGALREAMIRSAMDTPVRPALDCLEDQIIWGRSPVRLDLAGGWTDTPPYCFINGGKVVNIAVELNGQPPIQVFARPRKGGGIKLRSIDLGVSQELNSYEELRSYAEVGSGFAIPKAALALCGFLPEFHSGKCPPQLPSLLERFGSGIEISLLCAVPKGSGLGTSSILSATILGVLSDLCQLGWDTFDIGQRVLVLEQMLTSGGGWQDQYGGICRGLKYLETQPGLEQNPIIRWIDDHLFTEPSIKPNILLYYTGLTRVAKSVLGEIVRGMFLNSQHRLDVLEKIGENAQGLQHSLQEGRYDGLCRAVARSWELNQSLDPGTNPPEIAALLEPLAPWLAGCKLLGAGGGGYLLMLANDSSCAQKIVEHLEASPPNDRARFVSLDVSADGLQVTRS
ncbi:MAG: bifunctional fucokinase/fucose-1-phosphate guanylyltransferase [Oceanipulchritudo sp.]